MNKVHWVEKIVDDGFTDYITKDDDDWYVDLRKEDFDGKIYKRAIIRGYSSESNYAFKPLYQWSIISRKMEIVGFTTIRKELI